MGKARQVCPGEELTTKSRAAASHRLVLATLTVAAAVYSAIANFPRGLVVAARGAWYGLLRRGLARVVGLGLAALLALAAVLIVIFDSGIFEFVLIGVLAFGTVAATKAAFAVRVPLPDAADPSRPVLFSIRSP